MVGREGHDYTATQQSVVWFVSPLHTLTMYLLCA